MPEERQGVSAKMAAFRQACREAAEHTIRLIRDDAGLYLVILLYTAAGLALLAATGAAGHATYGVYLVRWIVTFAMVFPAIALLIDLLLVVHRFDDRRRLAMRSAFSIRRIACLLSGMALMMMMMLFQGTFTSLKSAMTFWQGGFLHDRVQADIDRWLHFGVDPWRLLYAFGEHEMVRRIVEVNYNMVWFLICFGALFFVLTSPRMRAVRARYLVCFMLIWVICGNLVAGLFLSAGPAFYGAVTGDVERFAGQMAFLAQGIGQPHSAATYQNYLWSLHDGGTTGFGSGISAFPSVHVAMIAMIAMFLAEHSRRLAMLAFAYVAFIVASSVYLAWHYAIDGYVSIAMVVVIHLLVRRFMPAAGGARRPARSADAAGPLAPEGVPVRAS